jgi:hypothetical protein
VFEDFEEKGNNRRIQNLMKTLYKGSWCCVKLINNLVVLNEDGWLGPAYGDNRFKIGTQQIEIEGEHSE